MKEIIDINDEDGAFFLRYVSLEEKKEEEAEDETQNNAGGVCDFDEGCISCGS